MYVLVHLFWDGQEYTYLIIRKLMVYNLSCFVHIYMAARKGKTTIFAYTKCKWKN